MDNINHKIIFFYHNKTPYLVICSIGIDFYNYNKFILNIKISFRRTLDIKNIRYE